MGCRVITLLLAPSLRENPSVLVPIPFDFIVVAWTNARAINDVRVCSFTHPIMSSANSHVHGLVDSSARPNFPPITCDRMEYAISDGKPCV